MSARALRDVAVNASPAEAGAHARGLLDRTTSTPDSESRYLACVRAVVETTACDPAWLPWLVGDALARTVRADESPFGDFEAQLELVARVVALAVHHRWERLDTLEIAGDTYFERIATGVRTVEHDDRQFFERVVSETATLLDEEYVSGLAALDWQDAFDGS